MQGRMGIQGRMGKVLVVAALVALTQGCGEDNATPDQTGGTGGILQQTGGTSGFATGGTGGGLPTGGTGGFATGGVFPTGGMGGMVPTGGTLPTGGVSTGGGSPDGGMGGTGGQGSEYCPANETCRVLPLGNSITDGMGVVGGGGYRIPLFHLALQNGDDMTFVGTQSNGPATVDGEAFPQAHEGHSGWTIQQIHDLIQNQNVLSVDPHIILLHIGTNDMVSASAGAPDRLGSLIDLIVERKPDALLVVSTIIPLPMAESTVATYNAAVPGVVNQRAQAGAHVVLVDQFQGFPSSELADGVHPNEAGYSRMADVWYQAISSYFN